MIRSFLLLTCVLGTGVCSAEAAIIWLSESVANPPGSLPPAGLEEVPHLQPFVGASQTLYIWGRPDAGKAIENLSLNIAAETSPANPGDMLQFTNVTLFNDPFGTPANVRFEFVDDSNSSPPLPIVTNRIDGIDGLTVLNSGSVPAVGIGDASDPLYDGVHDSWLIGSITYNVLAASEGRTTHLYLEIGPVGVNHVGEPSAMTSVVFGHLGDELHNGQADRNLHRGSPEATISSVALPGDSDRNGVVDISDHAIWKNAFGSTNTPMADHNGNSLVDAADFTVWRDNKGVVAALATSVPEPSAYVVLLWTFFGGSVGLRFRGKVSAV